MTSGNYTEIVKERMRNMLDIDERQCAHSYTMSSNCLMYRKMMIFHDDDDEVGKDDVFSRWTVVFCFRCLSAQWKFRFGFKVTKSENPLQFQISTPLYAYISNDLIWFCDLNAKIALIPFTKFILVGLFLENSDLTNSKTWFRAIVVIRWFMAISPPRALSHPHQCWRKMMNSHWTSHFVNVKINNVSFISFDFSHLFSRQLEVWYVSQFESGRRLHMDETGIRARAYIYIYLCILTHTYPFSSRPESIFATVRKQTKCYFLYTDTCTLPTDGQAAVCGMREGMRLLHSF